MTSRTAADPLDLAAAQHERALSLYAEGRLTLAARAAEQSLAGFARHAGRDHPDVASALDTLAMIDLSRGRVSEAIRGLRRAVAVLDRHPRLAAVRPFRAQSLVRLGDALREAGRYPAARDVYARALRVARGAFGARSVEYAAALNGYGVLCKYAGRFADGRRAYRRALALAEALGADELVMALLHNLGGIEHAADRFSEAEPWARRGLALRVARDGEDHPAALEDRGALAAIVADLGRHDEAIAMLRALLAQVEARYGASHYEAAVVCHNLAAALAATGDLDESEVLYRRALTAKRASLGASHPDLVVTMHNLASVLAARGDARAAHAMRRRALSLATKTLGARHPTTRACAVAVRAHQVSAGVHEVDARAGQGVHSPRR